LLLVRHSEPLRDAATASELWQLSDEGRARCTALAARLAPFAPRRLVSSPEPKAHETAELIAPALGLAVELDDRLRETARRTVGWLPREELDARIRDLFARPNEIVFGEESAASALARFEAALAKLPADSVVVTHGTILSLYVAARTDRNAYELWRSLLLPDVVEV
jgi:broad specificity phosphatase PhoE